MSSEHVIETEGGSVEFTFDDSNWPLVVVTTIGEHKTEHILEVAGRVDAALARGERFALILDMRRAGVLSAEQRALLSDLKTERARFSRGLMVEAFVLENAMQRAILTALNLLSPPAHPQRLFGSLVDARAWCVAQLATSGVLEREAPAPSHDRLGWQVFGSGQGVRESASSILPGVHMVSCSLPRCSGRRLGTASGPERYVIELLEEGLEWRFDTQGRRLLQAGDVFAWHTSQSLGFEVVEPARRTSVIFEDEALASLCGASRVPAELVERVPPLVGGARPFVRLGEQRVLRRIRTPLAPRTASRCSQTLVFRRIRRSVGFQPSVTVRSCFL